MLDENALEEDDIWRAEKGFHRQEKYDHEYPDYEGDDGEDDIHEDWDDEYELRKLHQKGF